MRENLFPLTNEAIAYTLTQLIYRAGWQDSYANLPVFYGRPDDFTGNTPVIIIPMALDTWCKLLTLPPLHLVHLSRGQVMPFGQSLPIGTHLPVLFWGAGYKDGSKPFAERRADGTVIFYADIIATTFFMLSRWEETVVADRDEHGRFPATASVAYKQGFLDRPIVDEYALILREWIKVLLPRWRPKQNTFSVKLSHDIDNVSRFHNIYAALHAFGGDLLKRRSPKRAGHTARDAWAHVVAPARTDHVQDIYHLADISRKDGLNNDAFYFMAEGPGPFGSGYDPTLPVVKKCIADLRQWGFEVGLHPSYEAFQNPARLAEEKARMDAVLGETNYGGRQHFLRFQVPDTWRHWEQVGLAYDSTLGYADHEGFRCGTSHPFRPFDIAQNRELDIWEIPLVAMDATLRRYRGLTPQQARSQLLSLAKKCRQVEGMFTLLWHNSTHYGSQDAWWRMYQQVVEMVTG